MTAWLATLLRPGTGALRAHFRLSRWDERRAKIRRRRREESHSEKSAIHNRQSEIEMSLVTSTPTKLRGALRRCLSGV